MMDSAKDMEDSLDQLFSRATQDASAYLWACARYADPPEGYGREDLLLAALAGRARARLALSRAREAGPDYEAYANKLSRIIDKAEEELSRLRSDLGPSFGPQAARALEQEARRLSAPLGFVGGAGADADLFGADPESFAGFTENAQLFVLGFADLSRARTELASLEKEAGETAGPAVDRLEAELSRQLGYFAPVSGFMEAARDREYGDNPWWLESAPDPARVPAHGFSDEELEPYAEAFRREADTAPRECPLAFEAISVALSEADPGLRKKVMAHADTCRFCRRLLLDVSAASTEESAGAPPREVFQAIGAALDERFPPEPERAVRASGLRRAAAVLAVLLAVVLFVVIGRSYLIEAEPPPAPSLPADLESRLPIPRAIAPLAPGPRQGTLSITARRHRGMYLGGAVSGFSVFPLQEGGKLKSGDEFRVHASVTPESYVYLFFQAGSGKISALASGKLPAGETLTLPDRDAWFSLDYETGRESVWLLATNRPILRFEARLELLEALGIAAMDKIFPEEGRVRFSFDHVP